MTASRVAARLALGLVALMLAGCANLPFLDKPKPATDEPPAVALQPAYELEVQAPDAQRTLLSEYLDLARFRNVPATDIVTAPELDRLLQAAPAQARSLLETMGYFNAEVSATRVDDTSAAALPRVLVAVQPGPRAVVGAVAVSATGELQDRALAGDAAAAQVLATLRTQWPLTVGDPFVQPAWISAKSSSLAGVRAQGYAAASWRSTNARVDAQTNRVDLAVEVDSGPLFRFGEIRIEGLSRYDADSVLRLANFSPGMPYSEKQLADFQERLQKLGLFEGAAVELDADPKTASAAPVRVRVKEQTLQQATVGVGFSANTGARVSLEHYHREVFGTRWVAKNKLQLGPKEQTWDGELISHPLDGLYRNVVTGNASNLLVADQKVLSWTLRAGRTQDTPRIERHYFAEYTRAQLTSDTLSNDANALSYNYHWIFRDLDSVLLPTKGLTASLQAAGGYSRGTQSSNGAPDIEEQGPFVRLYGRLTWYEQIGASWYGTARIEAGQVFTKNVIGVPDTLLFRAGGDDSVRGYAYRTLGPTTNGVVTSGRNLATASVEVARPISPNYPAYWWAAFVDAGNAADGWGQFHPVLGYGLGLRWRSPVGPLRVDVSYGQETHQVRVSFNVGVTF